MKHPPNNKSTYIIESRTANEEFALLLVGISGDNAALMTKSIIVHLPLHEITTGH